MWVERHPRKENAAQDLPDNGQETMRPLCNLLDGGCAVVETHFHRAMLSDPHDPPAVAEVVRKAAGAGDFTKVLHAVEDWRAKVWLYHAVLREPLTA